MSVPATDQNRDGATWLVKSSGRVLGPFTSNRVAELLRLREISVLDEIAPPLRRWQTLQYHDEFIEVVEALRKAVMSERTEVTWAAGTHGVTQTLTDLDSPPANGSTVDGNNEIVLHNVQEEVMGRSPATLGRYQSSLAQTDAIDRKVETATRGLWLVTALILAIAIGFGLQKKFGNHSSGTAVRPSVLGEIQVGHYASALKTLKATFSDPLQAGDLAIPYASLLILLEKQTVLGRRLLNQAAATHRGDPKQISTGLALADLVDGQFDLADEGFKKVLAQDPEYVPALVNQAMVALHRVDYKQAKRLAEKALSIEPTSGEAVLVLTEAESKITGADSVPRAAIVARIGRFRTQSWDFAPELAFYSLYLDALNDPAKIGDRLPSYFDLDPRLTADHRHNLFIYHARAPWAEMAKPCEVLAEKLSDPSLAALLGATCAIQAGRTDEARTKIDQAVHLSPQEALTQAWDSYVRREAGDTDQASVVLGRAMELNRRGQRQLPTLMQARFCQVAGIVDCARENWKNLYERDADNLPAVAGMAWVKVQLKSNADANKLINHGLKLSPDYIPLLELKARGENEGWFAAN